MILLAILVFVVLNIGVGDDVLDENIIEFSFVADRFLKNDAKYIIWHSTEPNEIDCNDEAAEIDIITLNNDFELKENIKKLNGIGIKSIKRIDNFVEFTTWSSLDSSNGFIYCSKGIPNPEGSGKTKIIETSINNWYIFVHKGD